MKNIKLIVLTTVAMLFLGMGDVYTQEEPSKTVIIRVREAGMTAPAIVVTDGDGKTNKIDLEKGHGIDESANNAVLIQKELDKWKREGYRITHLSTTGEAYLRTTIILEK